LSVRPFSQRTDSPTPIRLRNACTRLAEKLPLSGTAWSSCQQSPSASSCRRSCSASSNHDSTASARQPSSMLTACCALCAPSKGSKARPAQRAAHCFPRRWVRLAHWPKGPNEKRDLPPRHEAETADSASRWPALQDRGRVWRRRLSIVGSWHEEAAVWEQPTLRMVTLSSS
jgi:hypothetical protein